MKRVVISIVVLVLVVLAVVYTIVSINNSRLSHDESWAEAAEVTPVVLPIDGSVMTTANIEFSGMAWHGDLLVLLPQYPSLFGNTLFALEKEHILKLVNKRTLRPLEPIEIGLASDGVDDIEGFEGLESIMFSPTHVFMTVEASPDDMEGYLVRGQLMGDGSDILLDGASLQKITPQAELDNYTDETIVLVEDNLLLTIYEANGENVNETPVAHLFTTNVIRSGTVPMPNIEYRITDATAVDENGRFWVTNYTPQLSISKLDPVEDPLFAQYGIGATHAENNVVERLIELEFTGSAVELTETPPIQLELLGDDTGRNWEGIVRLDDLGFLVVTDQYPETILAFVPFE